MDIADLEAKTNAAIEDGYTPLGGIVVAHPDTLDSFYQTMVRL